MQFRSQLWPVLFQIACQLDKIWDDLERPLDPAVGEYLHWIDSGGGTHPEWEWLYSLGLGCQTEYKDLSTSIGLSILPGCGCRVTSCLKLLLP